uniref:Splicing factor YJU2 n=1 Tax=Acrobeloides nanus TaxID=290746 RepID=A0A914CCL8_9BILA
MTGTERKVFQKYYPPDFDPSKIPRAKQKRNHQWVQRVMAPYNMQCNTCSEYIYKGKKFNMRREMVEGETYLGLRLFRFYFRCPNCLAEITFTTDLENCDYRAEHGATRLFDAFKYYQEQAKTEEDKDAAEKTDAMKMLEKRTKMSRAEMDAMGKLEELQEVNRRNEKINAIEFLKELERQSLMPESERLKAQEEEDERFIRELYGKTEDGKTIRRINDTEPDIIKAEAPSTSKASSVTSSLADLAPLAPKKEKRQNESNQKKLLKGLVIVKKPKLENQEIEIKKEEPEHWEDSTESSKFRPSDVRNEVLKQPKIEPVSSSSLSSLAVYGSDSDISE